MIAMIDVDQQQGIKDRKFRMRKLVVEPGGIVPWHSHGERGDHLHHRRRD